MPRTSSRFAFPRGIFGPMIVAGVFVVMALYFRVWQIPRESPHAVGLIILAGLGLGVFGLLRRPSWQLRAASLATLLVAAIVLNLLWIRETDRRNGRHAFEVQEDDYLSSRYFNHYHWIPRQQGAYFVMADLLKGKQIRYIEGSQLGRWRLAALAEPSEIVEKDPPSYPLPTPQQLEDLYPNRKYWLHLPSWRGQERLYQMVGITRGAKEAEYFVVLEVDGVDFVIPDSVWEAIGRDQTIGRGQGPPGPL